MNSLTSVRISSARRTFTGTFLVGLGSIGFPLAAAQNISAQSESSMEMISVLARNRTIPALEREVSVDLKQARLADALQQIADEADFHLTYAWRLLDPNARVTLEANRIKVAEAVARVLDGTGLDLLVAPNGQAVLVQKPEPQNKPEPPAGTITGRVTDAATGAGVPGATVRLRDTRLGTTTDAEGRYRLAGVPVGEYTLVVERIGYGSVSRAVSVAQGAEVRVDFGLELSATALDEIVVTGSRIRRTEIEGPSPVVVLTRENLNRTGRATVAEALATLPQNFAAPLQTEGSVLAPARVDLRGLGSDNTLVLVNGRRMANSGFGPNGATTFVDLNSIPLGAVERIEVLTSGASAVYGSDALAGVVNIILKDDFHGTEISLNYGASSEGGAGEQRVSFTTGGARAGLRGLLSGEYFRRGRLATTDRAFSQSGDQRARGGRDFRGTVSSPGNVRSLDGQNLTGLDVDSAGIPRAQDGRNLIPADFAATAGQLNLESLNSYIDLVAPSERWGFNGRLDWELSSKLTLLTEAGVSLTTNEPNSLPPSRTVTVPAGNPFNPFGQVVEVEWLATELSRRVLSKTDGFWALLGLEGRLGDGWAWQTSVGYSRDEFDMQGSLRLDPQTVDALLSRTDPATALNVFGDGAGANTPAVLDALTRGSSRQSVDGVSDLVSWEGQLDGVLARWAGRELRAAVGAEYRQESMDHTIQNVFPQAPPQVTRRTAGDRDVLAGFAELSLPLFSPEHQQPGLHALELQLAGRWESYSDFGQTFNPRLAARWQPIGCLTLRASASTGFRAPALQELFLSGTDIPNVQVTDPRRNNETVPVLLKTGGNPDLEPEESESWNVGLVWDVAGVRGLSLTLDAYRVEQDEQITQPGFLFTQFNEEFEATFPDRIRRAEPTPEDLAAGRPGQLVEIDSRNLNVSHVTAQGVDLGLNYVTDTAFGLFDLRLNGAYIDRLEQQLTPLSPVEDVAGKTHAGLASTGSPTRFRGNATLVWSRAAWEVGIIERYTGGTRETNPASPLFDERYNDHFETDLQLGYRFPGTNGPFANIRISLGVENVFNEEPPFRDSEYGYLGSLYSPRQRFSHLTLTKAF